MALVPEKCSMLQYVVSPFSPGVSMAGAPLRLEPLEPGLPLPLDHEQGRFNLDGANTTKKQNSKTLLITVRTKLVIWMMMMMMIRQTLPDARQMVGVDRFLYYYYYYLPLYCHHSYDYYILILLLLSTITITTHII